MSSNHCILIYIYIIYNTIFFAIFILFIWIINIYIYIFTFIYIHGTVPVFVLIFVCLLPCQKSAPKSLGFSKGGGPAAAVCTTCPYDPSSG